MNGAKLMNNFKATDAAIKQLNELGVDRVTAAKVLKRHLFDCLKEMKDAVETSVLFREEG